MCNSPDCKCPIDYSTINLYDLFDMLPDNEQKSIHNWLASSFTFKELAGAWEEVIIERSRKEKIGLNGREREIKREFKEIKNEIINILKKEVL